MSFLTLVGVLVPAAIAGYLFRADRELYQDLKNRLSFKGIKGKYLFLTLFLTSIALLLGQLLSVLFLEHSLDQFQIVGSPSFHLGIFSGWFILVFASVVEELAWHTYGLDSLCRKYSLFTSSIIFGFYWAIWHFPLAAIKGYYHSNVAESGWVYTLNFLLSVFAFVILMNWLYFKTGRNIWVAVLFHLFANVTNELFNTHPDSKVIQTIILTIIMVIVLVKEKDLFFKKMTDEG